MMNGEMKMNREEVFIQLKEVFQDVFDDEDIEIGELTSTDDIEEWDSLTHITLVVAVEKEFHIKLNMREVNNMKNVGEMVSMILERME